MPNCDFYATPADHEQLLRGLFEEESCRVFELASAVEQPLQEFRSASEVLAQFDRTYANGESWHAVHLQLYVLGAGPPFVPARIPLKPSACNGATFRYSAEGWGLVQLYLAAPKGLSLANSHTNHNSQKRAEAWAASLVKTQAVELWDFKKISAFSARLNRQIKKLSVAKIGSRPILPGALDQWRTGTSLAPFQGEDIAVEMRCDA